MGKNLVEHLQLQEIKASAKTFNWGIAFLIFIWVGVFQLEYPSELIIIDGVAILCWLFFKITTLFIYKSKVKAYCRCHYSYYIKWFYVIIGGALGRTVIQLGSRFFHLREQISNVEEILLDIIYYFLICFSRLEVLVITAFFTILCFIYIYYSEHQVSVEMYSDFIRDTMKEQKIPMYKCKEYVRSLFSLDYPYENILYREKENAQTFQQYATEEIEQGNIIPFRNRR